jgi:membrane protein
VTEGRILSVLKGSQTPHPSRPEEDHPHRTIAGAAADGAAEAAIENLRARFFPPRPDRPGRLPRDGRSGQSGPSNPAQDGAREDRGRSAGKPAEIPARGWKDILLRVKDRLGEDHLTMIAAGVAFYALLAIFPGIAALVSLYGLVFDAADVERQMSLLAGVLPGDALAILTTEVKRVATASSGSLTFGALGGLGVALWSATSGTKALFEALNIAYAEKEKRGFFRLTAIALVFTLGAVLFVVLALALIAIVPVALDYLGLGETGKVLISVLRWPLLAAGVIVALGLLYRHGPSRDHPQWRWLSWGAAAATVLWLVGSLLFSFYVSNFGDYNATYGSVGAIVILLMWFYISALIILVGAELNAEMEHQTVKDTTQGPPQPMGRRGATMADTIASKR